MYAILLPIYDFFAFVSKFSDAAGETNTGRIAAGCCGCCIMLPLAIASFVLMCLALGNPFAPFSECAGYDFFDLDNGTVAVNPDITDLNSSSWTAVASDAVTADGIYDPRHGGCMLRNEIEYEVQLADPTVPV